MQPGEFTIDHPCGIRISRRLLQSDVVGLAGVTKRDMGTGFVWYSLPASNLGLDGIVVSLCFHLGALDSLSFAVTDTGPDGRSWSNWSEDNERVKAKRIEDWLAAQGHASGRYPWGEIWAGFDSKSGSGGAGVRYSREKRI